MILVLLLSLFAVVSSQPLEQNSPACSILKNVYDAMCPNQTMTTAPAPSTPMTTAARTTTTPSVDCVVEHDGTCLWIEGSHDAQITYEQGRMMCEAKGGAPGNIYSKSDHDTIYAHMSQIAKLGDGQFYVWLGLKYNRATNSALLSDGRPAPYTHWGPGFPSRSYCCYITLVSGTDPLSKPDHGSMHNWVQAASKGVGWRRGVLCEK